MDSAQLGYGWTAAGSWYGGSAWARVPAWGSEANNVGVSRSGLGGEVLVKVLDFGRYHAARALSLGEAACRKCP